MRAEKQLDRALNLALSGFMGAVGYAFAMWWHEWSPILGFVLVFLVAALRATYFSGVLLGGRK